MNKMKCNKCGNDKDFVRITETALWNSDKEEWEDITDCDEMTMCDKCNSFDVEN